MTSHTPKTDEEKKKTEYIGFATLPYIKGVSERIGRVLAKENIKTAFKPITKIKDLLPNVKSQISMLDKEGVYEIPCTCGKNYIGQTRRSLKTRIKEHIRDAKEGKIETSAIAEHIHNTSHTIKFDEVKLLHHITDYGSRLNKEAIEIYKCGKLNFNRDAGWGVKNPWKPLLQQRTTESRYRDSQQKQQETSQRPTRTRPYLGRKAKGI
jgi:hypothetical protein